MATWHRLSRAAADIYQDATPKLPPVAVATRN